jgi:hypothetical protein
LHRIVILGFRNFNGAIVSGVEEDGTRRHTTMCDDIAPHCSGVEQAAPQASVSGVEDAAAGSVSLSLPLSVFNLFIEKLSAG